MDVASRRAFKSIEPVENLCNNPCVFFLRSKSPESAGLSLGINHRAHRMR